MLISGTDKLGIFFLTISLSIGLSSKKTNESVDKFNSLLISKILDALLIQLDLNDTKSESFKGHFFFFKNIFCNLFRIF